jgi:hypothetical protein
LVNLKKISTRELLVLLSTARILGETLYYGDIVYENDLRKELSKREHIPNKKENKELIKQRKKSGTKRKKGN